MYIFSEHPATDRAQKATGRRRSRRHEFAGKMLNIVFRVYIKRHEARGVSAGLDLIHCKLHGREWTFW